MLIKRVFYFLFRFILISQFTSSLSRIISNFIIPGFLRPQSVVMTGKRLLKLPVFSQETGSLIDKFPEQLVQNLCCQKQFRRGGVFSILIRNLRDATNKMSSNSQHIVKRVLHTHGRPQTFSARKREIPPVDPGQAKKTVKRVLTPTLTFLVNHFAATLPAEGEGEEKLKDLERRNSLRRSDVAAKEPADAEDMKKLG